MFSQYKFPFHIFVAVSTILFYYLLRRYRTTSATNDRTTSDTDRTTSATNDRTTPKTKFDTKKTTIEKESITTPNTKTNIYLSMYIPIVLYIGFFITNSINCGSGNAVENAVDQILSPGSIMSELYQSSIIL